MLAREHQGSRAAVENLEAQQTRREQFSQLVWQIVHSVLTGAVVAPAFTRDSFLRSRRVSLESVSFLDTFFFMRSPWVSSAGGSAGKPVKNSQATPCGQ
jgi:hypothetical protein